MTEIDVASMQGVALGFSIGVTLLYIARRRLGGWTRTAQERAKLDEHAQLTTDLAVTKSKLNDLSSENSELTERLDLSVVRANELQGQLTDAKGEYRAVAATLASELNGSNDLRRRLEEAERLLNQHRSTADEVSGKLALSEQQLLMERQAAQEKLDLLMEAKQTLTDQFKTLATEILEEKSTRFAASNAAQIGLLLDPVKVKLQEFQSKVEEVYVTESNARSALEKQVTLMMKLNKDISDEAKNLTQALKGSNKAQGNWGELVLRRVLESSGLRKDHEFLVQETHQREDGSRAIPDVIVCLPQGRNLVVDSKVSLTAFTEAMLIDDEKEREVAIKKHVLSLRTHIKGLATKNYQQLYASVKSLDFVIMFVPIEPAFVMAVAHDEEIFMDAWSKNVLLVSPSTLLFVLRTIEHLWKQEAQSKNAMDIAKRGGMLYDKLCGFVEDLKAVGGRIKQAQESYDLALGKLSTGNGNAIQQAVKLKELGASTTKNLPDTLTLSQGDATSLGLIDDSDVANTNAN